MPYEDLRQFLNFLEKQGELLQIKKEVETKYEIAAYIRKTSDTRGPALLFEKVKGFDIKVVGGVFATNRRALIALECTQDEVHEKFFNCTLSLIPPMKVSHGPCQEIIYRDDEVDLTKLPVPIYSALDSGAYITLGVISSKDPDTGSYNRAIYRMEVKGKNRLGVLSSGRHLGLQIAHAESKGQPLEVTIALGCDPAIIFATQWSAPFGVDELGLAGSLRGKPVEVVACQTVNLETPARAEIVIEGKIPPDAREMEGPFGEFSGYYTPAYPKPIIEVTAITQRKNPIFQAALTGMPTTENHILKQIPIEAGFYGELKQKFPGIKKVHFPGAGGVGYLAIISMKPTSKYQSRSVLTTMLGSGRSKYVIVVDDDIDIYDMDKVLWAICTRSQPSEDTIIVPKLPSAALDPSAPERGSASCMGIDATRPFGEPFPEMIKIPGLEKISELK